MRTKYSSLLRKNWAQDSLTTSGPPYGHLLLGPLENLAAVEETVVREKASESITKIAEVLSEEQVQEYYIPLLRRLSGGDWFTSRTSSASLFAAVYSKSWRQDTGGAPKDVCCALQRRHTHGTTCSGKRPGAFRKEIIQGVGRLGHHPAFPQAFIDDQDSVRLLTVQDLISIAEVLDHDETKNYLLPSIRSAVSDKSWRVRYMVADHFVKLASAVGEDVVRDELVLAFVQLLRDNEAEVRTAGAAQIPGFAKLIDQDVILARLMPCVRELASDSSQHVRAALGTQISGLAPLLGKDATIEHLLPLFLKLLKDEFSDVALTSSPSLNRSTKVSAPYLASFWASMLTSFPDSHWH
ncbi:hypothetical protein L7F22_001964 [Adiantum nelumboides]|nr:hypothetical protein [Adiantum nelumboides]